MSFFRFGPTRHRRALRVVAALTSVTVTAAVVACLSGSFVVKNTGQLYGYGIYNGGATAWVNADGYLPALTTSFHSGDAAVSITNFGDKVTIGGNPFVVIYSRVTVT